MRAEATTVMHRVVPDDADLGQPNGETMSSPSADVGSEPLWFACYTHGRHEKHVDRLLRERGIETYVPLAPVRRQWKDRRKIVKLPMFPSYVFCRTGRGEVWQVRSVHGVVDIVRSNGAPVPIRVEDLENVRRFAEALTTHEVEPELRPYISEGTRVKIVAGPFKGITGIVTESRNGRRVHVGLAAIGHGLEIDVDARVLEPVSPPRQIRP